ncbi:NAD(P)/FAD-dependent oxidoreductase [Falsiroseomonas oryzae]|uniref:NAD(P)/FAD-dependent oxidoreductase n=1 Tax=Falsiroseomonas oryzae TaxID=2766473 RepID=UPI0022EA5849|nr:FAD-dependent oxidoreductase [Roseomonas sp. MO-31]
MRRTVVIIGAGQAGGRMAEALRQRGSDARILLVGDEPEPPYERPPLSKEVLADASAEVAARLGGGEPHWRSLDVELMTGLRATGLDRAARRVVLSDGGALGYDTLVLATGSRARQLALPGTTVPVLALRSLADARALRGHLGPGRTVLLLGGGVIGLEVAASATARGASAVVVEAAPRLMSRCASPFFADRLLAMHRARGVAVHLGARLARVEGRVATLSDGTRVEADLVLVGIGAVANDEVAAASGLPTRDGILVDGHGRTADPSVLAVGEVARHPLARFGIADIRQESWRHADSHPRAVAAALLGATAAAYDEVPGFWSDQHGERFLVEGLPGRGQHEVLRDADGPRPVAFHLDAEGAVVGAATLGDTRAMAVARRLIAARARPDPARLADAGADLRALLR